MDSRTSKRAVQVLMPIPFLNESGQKTDSKALAFGPSGHLPVSQRLHLPSTLANGWSHLPDCLSDQSLGWSSPRLGTDAPHLTLGEHPRHA
jgi:hypothetical protein